MITNKGFNSKEIIMTEDILQNDDGICQDCGKELEGLEEIYCERCQVKNEDMVVEGL